MTMTRNQDLWFPNAESMIKYSISDATSNIGFSADLLVQGFHDKTLRIKIDNPQFFRRNDEVNSTEAAPILESLGLIRSNEPIDVLEFARYMKVPMTVLFKKGRAKSIVTMKNEPSSVTEMKKNLARQLEQNTPSSYVQLIQRQQIDQVLQMPFTPKIVNVRLIMIKIKLHVTYVFYVQIVSLQKADENHFLSS